MKGVEVRGVLLCNVGYVFLFFLGNLKLEE